MSKRQTVKEFSRKRLVKETDDVFSLFIRRRDGFKCVTCGYQGFEKDGVMQAGHLFTGAANSTRWDPLNTHCQCRGCNFRHEFDWEPYRMWFVSTYGSQVYDELYRKHKTVKKFTKGELLALYEYYKNANKEYELIGALTRERSTSRRI